MSSHSIFHGWKARTFHLSRDRGFLLRTSFAIVGAAFVLGCALVWLRTDPNQTKVVGIPALLVKIQSDYGRLHQSSTADQRLLCRWLSTVMEQIRRTEEVDSGAESGEVLYRRYLETGRVFEYDLHALIDAHAPSPSREMFRDYVEASLQPDKEKAESFRTKIDTLANGTPPPPCASELAAGLALRAGAPPVAVAWLMREGLSFPEAKESRRAAVHLALEIQDVNSLQSMRDVPGWIEGCTPSVQSAVGGLLMDVPLLWKAMLWDHFTDIPWLYLFVTLMVGGVWTVILVQHDEVREWRWVRPILPVIAGVASIWPTVAILYWQEYAQGLVKGGEFPMDIWYWIIGVGAREEISKLALFAVFLPWLVKARAPGRALLTGAFVGLGFAIEENVQYYHSEGVTAVLGRLLTANFLHICLTAIVSHELYRVFRSRFATAGDFVVTFGGVILAHGLYDWLGDADPYDVGGWLGIALFLMIAIRFFDLLAQEMEWKRSTVSHRAVFVLGCAVIVAVVFVLAGIQGNSIEAVAEAGQSCLGIVPVAIFYWRKFEHA